jgi:type III secretory pathway lipoprotein EscJ
MAVVRADLEQTLQSVDGVLHVRVHLDAPRAILGPAEATKRPTASILLEHRGTAPPLPMADIQKLVAGAWVDLNPSDVAVVFISRPVLADSAASSPLRKVGPVWVAPSSARPLQWLLGLLCGLTAVFASSTMALYRKMRLQRFEASPREP